jgi:ABC-type phosphate transport system auxiliary subunit
MGSHDMWVALKDAMPILKWILTGASSIIASLLGYIWYNQKKRIDALEVTVNQLAKDSVRHVTHEDFDRLKDDMNKKMDQIDQNLSNKLDNHNGAVNGKLDALMFHLLNKDD